MHNHPPDEGGDGRASLPKRSLVIAIGLTGTIFLAEIAGGFISGSLSLLGDAAHMLQDVAALLLSLGAITIAERLPTPSRTFGFHRVEIGVAAVNGFALILVSALIIHEAYERFFHPQPIDSGIMLGVAVIGLVANVISMYFLHGSHDLNVKSAFLHVMGDTLSSVAVIMAAIWIAFTGQTIADPLISIGISLLILASSFSLLKESFCILLQFAPRGVGTEEVIREMESVPGVSGVHNVHVWSLCSNINVLDAHVYSCETDVHRLEGVKEDIKHRLEKYRIRHSTLEFECCPCDDCRMVQELKD